MPVEEIIAKFGIDGISPSPAMFDPKKLAWINETYVSRLTPDEIVGRNLPALTAAGLLPESASHAELEYARAVLRLELTRIKQPADAPETVGFFFPLLPYYLDRSVAKWLKGNDPYLKSVNDAVASLSDWSESALEEAVRAVGAETGREKGAVTHPVRVAVSGREAGPGLYEMMAVLGRERVLARLSHAVELARG
jgi:glutamyl/glutaminyl-tRNA synthetase